MKAVLIEKLLVENATGSRLHLKRRLYKEGLKQRFCELCGQGEEWRGKRFSLILDHINGIKNDNRFENLQIVCPNCNATLDTFSGKNVKHISKLLKNNCQICDIATNNKRTCSKKCLGKLQRILNRKIKWPSKEKLKKEVWKYSMIFLSKKYGVSDTTIKKWCKYYEIILPKQGYWNKLK